MLEHFDQSQKPNLPNEVIQPIAADPPRSTILPTIKHEPQQMNEELSFNSNSRHSLNDDPTPFEPPPPPVQIQRPPSSHYDFPSEPTKLVKDEPILSPVCSISGILNNQNLDDTIESDEIESVLAEATEFAKFKILSSFSDTDDATPTVPPVINKIDVVQQPAEKKKPRARRRRQPEKPLASDSSDEDSQYSNMSGRSHTKSVGVDSEKVRIPRPKKTPNRSGSVGKGQLPNSVPKTMPNKKGDSGNVSSGSGTKKSVKRRRTTSTQNSVIRNAITNTSDSEIDDADEVINKPSSKKKMSERSIHKSPSAPPKISEENSNSMSSHSSREE